MPRGGRWETWGGVQQASSFAAVAHAAKTFPIPPVLQCVMARGQGQGTALGARQGGRLDTVRRPTCTSR